MPRFMSLTRLCGSCVLAVTIVKVCIVKILMIHLYRLLLIIIVYETFISLNNVVEHSHRKQMKEQINLELKRQVRRGRSQIMKYKYIQYNNYTLTRL